MKNSLKDKKANESLQPTGKIKPSIKEVSFDENSPALLRKKKEAQALLQGREAQAH